MRFLGHSPALIVSEKDPEDQQTLTVNVDFILQAALRELKHYSNFKILMLEPVYVLSRDKNHTIGFIVKWRMMDRK